MNSVTPESMKLHPERMQEHSVKGLVEEEADKGPNLSAPSEHESELLYDRMEREASRFFSSVSETRESRQEEWEKRIEKAKKRHRDYRWQQGNYARNKMRRY